MTDRRLGATLVVALALLAFVPTGAANASPAFRCGPTTVAGGDVWSVVQRGTNCTFARYAVRLSINRHRSPRGWRCYRDQEGEFIPDPQDYRVRCYRGARRVVGRK